MEGIRFVADVTGALTFSIALPTLKRFTDEKIYPYFSEKWDTWRNQKRGVVCASKILDKSDISQEEKQKKTRLSIWKSIVKEHNVVVLLDAGYL